jgi:hypothetical protein
MAVILSQYFSILTKLKLGLHCPLYIYNKGSAEFAQFYGASEGSPEILRHEGSE